jgi:spore maturation protein CgeB
MKALFKFDLPEEQAEYEIFLQSGKLYCAMSDFKDFMRRQNKYIEHKNEEVEKKVDEIWEEFFRILEENNVKLDI